MARCPICEKPTEISWRPFCSKRCADIDLGKWMTGGYALPSDEPLSDQDIDRIVEGRSGDEPAD